MFEDFPPRCVGICPVYGSYVLGLFEERDLVFSRTCDGPVLGMGEEVTSTTYIDRDGYVGAEMGGPLAVRMQCTNPGLNMSIEALRLRKDKDN